MALRQTEFKIEKNVPLPETAQSTKGSLKYPLDSMSPGDSMFVAGDRALSRLNSYIFQAKQRGVIANTTVWTIRKTTEGQTLGARVWRVS